MLFDLCGVARRATEPLVGVEGEESDEKVPRIGVLKLWRDRQLALENAAIHAHLVFSLIEGRKSEQHLERHRSKRPPVDRLAILLSAQHLWRKILGRAAERRCDVHRRFLKL
eukprot:Amastigsp_a174663_523.p5 type:complete len:112 gc:universal Amastigsp_a174663_523:1180-845(-)